MDNYFVRMFFGIVISIGLTLVLLFVFSAILTYTNISEATIEPMIIGITGVSILAGSSITTSKIKKKGIINGMIIGGIYMLMLYITSSSLNNGFAVNIYTIIMMVIGMIAGAVGGIVGVNLK